MKLSEWHAPHFAMPHFHRGGRAVSVTHEHHPHHIDRIMNRIEGGIDVLAVLLIAVLAAALAYSVVTSTGYPAYFDRFWPG